MLAFFKKFFSKAPKELTEDPKTTNKPKSLDFNLGDLIVVDSGTNLCGRIEAVTVGLYPIKFRILVENISKFTINKYGRSFKYVYATDSGIYIDYYLTIPPENIRKVSEEEYETELIRIDCLNKTYEYSCITSGLNNFIDDASSDQLKKLCKELQYFQPMLEGISKRAIPQEPEKLEQATENV